MHWSEATGGGAATYAQLLLDALGVEVVVATQERTSTAAADWAASGAMALTGRTGGPPQLVSGAPATAVRGAVIALETMARATRLDVTLPAERLLGERGAFAGLTRQGAISPGGGTRLLTSRDGNVALTLSRPSDLELLPALLETHHVRADPWAQLAGWCAARVSADIVERSTHLGLAASSLGEVVDPRPFLTPPLAPRPPRRPDRLLVIDLSSLWAGPLASHLLCLLGARVVTVESTRRPDRSRDTTGRFHDLLRGGTQSVALDLSDPAGARRLRELLVVADIVIEGSRPRALAQLGIDADEVVAAAGNRTWVSITGHGRRAEAAHRIGFGDDTSVAAGLVGAGPVIAGDAIGDPLTGVHAAVAAYAGVLTARSHVVDVAMSRVVRACVTGTVSPGAVERRDGHWWLDTGADVVAVEPPIARAPRAAAPGLGSATTAVLSELVGVGT